MTALEVLLSDPKVKVLLINIFGGITRCDEVAEGLLTALDRLGADLPIVVRLDGTNEDEGRAILAERAPDNVVVEATMLSAAAPGGRAGGGGGVSILVDASTKLVVQGITGREGGFHATRNKAYGTQVVAGVTPGKSGQEVEGIPVFDTVDDAVSETGANTAMVFVPPRFAADAILEGLDSDVELVVCITEGIPAHDMLRVYAQLKRGDTTLVGPNCPGVISPGAATVGIMPTQVFEAGRVGVVSRSGTLTYQISKELGLLGIGQSTVVGIGGDPVVGSGFIDILERFEADPGTDLVVMVGEIGGDRGGEGRRLHRLEHVDARGGVRRRLPGPARQADGPRGRDHHRVHRHGPGQEGGPGGARRGRRVEPHRGRRAGQGAPGVAPRTSLVDLGPPRSSLGQGQPTRREGSMATLVVGTFLTVDGVMQAPGGPDEDERDGFAHGGWLVPLFDDDMRRIMVEHTLAADGLLLGRRTYELFAEHWPRVPEDDPIAAKLNAMPKFVASRTLRSVDWRNSALLEGDAAEAVAGLKRDREGEIQVTGSGDLIQTLLAADLVDEFRLWVFPVLLGTGRRLFAGGTVPAGLELVGSETTGSGVAFHTYRRAGAPEYGSFRLDPAA